MTNHRSTLAVGIFLTALSFSTVASAERVSVERCNFPRSGGFFPGLKVVADGKTSIFQMDHNGLTRSILFSESKAITWIEQEMGLEGVRIDYDMTCGSDDGEDRMQPMDMNIQTDTGPT